MSGPGLTHPTLRWLRLPHGGKARALNVACAVCETELVLTVDADTLLEPGALGAMRAAFADDPALTAATGVLTPVCGPSVSGRLLQWFQTYEYVRNFLSRYAWMQEDGLLLISGAFACYRRAALLAVGGFDPDCLVEDYELTHRLRDHAARQGMVWRTGVVGAAHARTDAPGHGGRVPAPAPPLVRRVPGDAAVVPPHGRQPDATAAWARGCCRSRRSTRCNRSTG